MENRVEIMRNFTFIALLLITSSSASWAQESSSKKQNSDSAATKEKGPIKLQSNFIGDKEQPLVSYFIPWKEIGTPDKLQWEIDSKHDNTLSLVDRKVILRLSSMYQTMELEKNNVAQVLNKQVTSNSDIPKSEQDKADLQNIREAK